MDFLREKIPRSRGGIRFQWNAAPHNAAFVRKGMAVASAITLEWERDSPCGTTRYTACCGGGGVSRHLVVRQCA